MKGEAMTEKERHQKQLEFVALRTQSVTYEEIAKALEVSKRTLIAWGRLFKDQIDQARQSAIVDALEAGRYTKAERVKKALSMLEDVEEAIGERVKSGDEGLKDLMQARETIRAEIQEAMRTANASGYGLQDEMGGEITVLTRELL